MKTVELLRGLREKNINIDIVDGELDIIVNDDNLTDELLADIKDSKEDLIEYLSNIGNNSTHEDFTFKGLKLREYKKILKDNELNSHSISDIYPLTSLQEGFLFHSLLDKSSSAYFEQIFLELEGSLDISTFEEAWRDVVERHDTLRTMFVSDFRVPVQIILKDRDLDFTYMDIREDEVNDNNLEQIKIDDRSSSFNMKKDPLFRIKLVQLEDKKYTLIISFHHIILDGWCMPIIISGFNDYYSKRLKNEEILLEVPPDYSNYIKWLNKRDTEFDLEYWKSYLTGYEQMATIPKDSIIDYTGKEEQLVYSFSINKEQTTSLKRMSAEIGVTFNSIIQTVWGIILSRYNGTDDVVFGSTVSGRPQEIDHVEDIVGLFINTIPVRIKTDNKKSFLETVLDVQRSALNSIDYHHTSLAEIQSISNLHDGLFDHIMVFENYPMDDAIKKLSSSLFSIRNIDSFEQINYDFGIVVFPSDTLSFSLSYNPKKYDEETIKRVSKHINKVISEVIINNEIKVCDIEIIPEEEKNLLLNVFNDTHADYPKDKTIIDLFEEQVEKTPDNIAVVFEDIELTYRELNEKSNIVGHYLRDNYDTKPDDLVGVFLERSEKMIIALLAILKSGAAYIPMDPDFPKDRIQYMIEDSNPKIIIGEREENRFIDINKILESSYSDKNPKKISNSQKLAYVIYTSGSTGRPKGTLLTNNSVVNFIWAMKDIIGFNTNKTIISVTTFSFDIFVLECFLPLSFGKKIVLANSMQQNDPFALGELIECHNVDTIQATPSRIKMLVSEKSLWKTLSRLTDIMVGGDIFPDDLLESLNECCKGNIYNMFGPTETTVWSTVASLKGEKTVHIGMPIANTQIYILDTYKKIVPIGVSGELYISGKGLSKGYLNNPKLTKDSFLNNPYLPGERMYKTGDQTMWLPDGNIKFFGRLDHQVKIRGYRIELSEIENVLGTHDSINSVVVIAKNINDDKQLVAYYIAERDIDSSELKQFSSKFLPNYMIPSFFVKLDNFPLTSNCKIDRKSLPEVSLDDAITGVGYIAPFTDIEKKLVLIWQDVLNIDKIGVLDNFFDIGGHSLKAIRVVSRIRDILKKNISLQQFFEYKTIESFAKHFQLIDIKDYNKIKPIEEREFYDLSGSQLRYWTLSQIELNSVAFTISAAFLVEGDFYPESFQKAYSNIINRYESLRTVFIVKNGIPKQKILNNPQFNIKIIQFQDYVVESCEVKKLIKTETTATFDLEKGPLVRFIIIKLKNESNIILFNAHHIVMDGWSINIFSRELLYQYNCYRNQESVHSKPLELQYKDFSSWQNKGITNNDPFFETQKIYWLNKLGGELPILKIPSDKMRPAIQTFNGKRISFSLTKKNTSKLKKLCEKHGITLFIMLQTLVKVLFYRYTGQEDIIIGTAVAGRTRFELEDQIGDYVNSVALRDKVITEDSFLTLLEKVKKTCNEALSNQDYPFHKLVSDLKLERDISRAPVFDVMLNLHNQDSLTKIMKDLKLSSYDLEVFNSRLDLIFDFVECDNTLNCNVEFNTDIYDIERIERMCNHIKVLTNSVLSDVRLKVKDLNIISKSEKHEIIETLNNTTVEYSKERTIVDLFEEQVERTPECLAVIYNDIELTYRELNERSNVIAHTLRETYNILPNDVVGVKLNRSEKMIIVLLGILKSGAAYIPIDPEYPDSRIKYMIEDSKPKIVIIDKREALICGINQFNISDLDYDKDKKANLNLKLNPDHRIYIIYTSGSTGKPKGSAISHRNFTNLLNWYISELKSDKNIKTLLVTSYGFDLTQKNLYSPLLVGGVLIITKSNIFDPSIINNEIDLNRISNLNCTPGMFYSILEHASLNNYHKLRSLRKVFLGGERIDLEPLKKWQNSPSYKACIINTYGPTECTDICLSHTIDFEINTKIVPLGKPIFNNQIFIVDNQKKLVPIGVPGELCISGDGLGLGYINNSSLNKDKFINNPYLSDERMYLTGDLGKWDFDGNIDFLGRIDSQVKIRGLRVELGEIENTLLLLEEVSSAVVLVHEISNSNKSLVAYLVITNKINDLKLKTFLMKYLPNYMIPSNFVVLKEMPYTVNGKVDRQLLPKFNNTTKFTSEKDKPYNNTQEDLIYIWKDVLGIEKIGINDNFFELGGNSLNAVSLITRIQSELKYDLKLNYIFENPTVNTLSNIILSTKQNEYKEIQPIEIEEKYYLSHGQKRLWILNQVDGENNSYNIINGFNLKGKINIEALKLAYKYMLERHESLRTTFITENGTPMQKVISIFDVNRFTPIIYEDFNDDSKIDKKINSEINYIFNICKEPLIRLSLIRKNIEEYIFILNMHHIISDGWSIGIFTNEFLEAYNCFNQNIQPTLAELQIQYKDYSFWQNSILESNKIVEQKDYWLKKLSGELPVLNFPSDNIRPLVKTINGDSIDFLISNDDYLSLTKLGLNSNASFFMVLNALVKILLYRYTEQEDIIIGTVSAGRNNVLLEKQIGFYVNTLALRDSINGELTFVEILDIIKKSTKEALDNQYYPFDMILEDLNTYSDASHSPLFDVLLVLQNYKEVLFEHDDLKVTTYQVKTNVSNFDITFSFEKKENGLNCTLIYNTDIYNLERILGLKNHLQVLIRSVISSPKLSVKNLEIIPLEEKQLLLHKFNNTKTNFTEDKTLIELFEKQVKKSPDNLALVFNDIELTYSELNEKANLVANYLRENYNILPDDIIGILLDRSEKMIIALLGILKSGAAYLPIESTLPEKRIEYMLQDSSPKVVISELVGYNHIKIDDILNNYKNTTNLCYISNSNNLAYIIYTSGSTGRPKGVMLEHKGVVNLIEDLSITFKMKKSDRVLLFSSISFDASVEQIWLALLTGAALVVISNELLSSSSRFNKYIKSKEISHINTVPSFLRDIDLEITSSLRSVIIGGETFPVQLANKYYKRTALFNGYGPTETTVISTAQRISSISKKSVLIGSALANTQIYILDKKTKCVPIGIPGELCISGVGLARGYLNNKVLTEEKFINNPYQPGDRMYKTGDLAAWLPDGNIELLGRIDNQVKIRGYRIELGEIENILIDYDLIESVVVVVKEATNKESMLIAYYISNEKLEKSKIKIYLKMLLPEYMIPSYLIQLNDIPLTINGKIDYKLLPKPEYSELIRNKEYYGPNNETQKKLVLIWQDVLGLTKIGIHDDFFELGGHSLKATKIISRIGNEFNIDIPLIDIFKNPTIENLDKIINAYQWAVYKDCDNEYDTIPVGSIEEGTI